MRPRKFLDRTNDSNTLGQGRRFQARPGNLGAKAYQHVALPDPDSCLSHCSLKNSRGIRRRAYWATVEIQSAAVISMRARGHPRGTHTPSRPRTRGRSFWNRRIQYGFAPTFRLKSRAPLDFLKGEARMTAPQAFLLGIVVAWGPSLLLIAWLVYRKSVRPD